MEAKNLETRDKSEIENLLEFNMYRYVYWPRDSVNSLHAPILLKMYYL